MKQYLEKIIKFAYEKKYMELSSEVAKLIKWLNLHGEKNLSKKINKIYNDNLFISKSNIIENDINKIIFPKFIEEETKLIIDSRNKTSEFMENKILLYGKPGTGKTTYAKELSKILGMKIVEINFADIVDFRMGETSKNLDNFLKINNKENILIFCDEIDEIINSRDNKYDILELRKLVTIFTRNLDLLSNKVLLVAATNRIGDLDQALIRRFDIKLNFDIYNSQYLLDIFKLYNKKYSLESQNFEEKIINHFLPEPYLIEKILKNKYKRKIMGDKLQNKKWFNYVIDKMNIEENDAIEKIVIELSLFLNGTDIEELINGIIKKSQIYKILNHKEAAVIDERK